MKRVARLVTLGAVALAFDALMATHTHAQATFAGSAQIGGGARPALRDTASYTSAPTFAMFDLRADHLDASFMRGRVMVTGWGQLDPAQFALRGNAAIADVDVAYAEGRFFAGDRVTVRIGRQLVLGGGARHLRLDGGHINALLVEGLRVNAWAGVFITPPFEKVQRADFATGGRLSYRLGTDSEVGASLTMVRDGAGWARQDIGLDARAHVHRMLVLSGYMLWSLGAGRLADLDLRATFQPVDMLSVLANYKRSSPELFLSQMSIFSVFAEQSRDEAGGEVGLYAHRRLTVDASGYWLKTPSGMGYRTSGRVSGKLGTRMQTQIGVEAGALRAPTTVSLSDGYVHLRAFLRLQLGAKWQVALDVASYLLARQINGHGSSLVATGIVTFEPAPAWRVGVTLAAGENPYYARYAEAFARLTYQFAVGGR